MIERGVRARILLVAGLLLLGVATPSFADPSASELQAARDLFAQAQKDEEKQDWLGALEKLKRVASVKVTPGVKSHMAACEEKLGQLVLALADYTAAETLAKQQNNAEVLAAIADPMAKLRARVPTLTINAPADAVVSLDEKRIASGVIGIPMPIDPGPHRIDAKLAGKPNYGATVRVKEKDAAVVDIKFDAPDPNPPKTDPNPPPTDPNPNPNPPKIDLSTPPPDTSPKKSSGSLVPGIVTAGGAVALVGLGIGMFVAADGAQSDLKNGCAMGMCPSDKKDAVHAFDTVTLISWIGAAGLAGLSIYFFATSGKSKNAEATIHVGPGAIRGTF